MFAPTAVSALRAVAAEIDSLHNDVHSPAREEASSHTHNLLLILRRDHGSDPATAFAWRSACCPRASSRPRDSTTLRTARRTASGAPAQDSFTTPGNDEAS
ncbi:terpene synthase family protein [Streptomyces virginiae]|uniref:terpene synthase family protein n=1 Tax=Streptomyces TaxID=1883 RepID=UPI00343241B2